jgi:hypothetical protein
MRSSNLNLNISNFQQQSISMLSPLVIYEDIAISQSFGQISLHKCLMSFNLGKKHGQGMYIAQTTSILRL